MDAPHLAKIKESVYSCTGFGICKGAYKETVSGCPMNLGSEGGFEAQTPRGIITMAREILEGRLEYTEGLAETVFRCTMCGNCRDLCGATDLKTNKPLFDPGLVALAMRTDLVELGMVPPPVRDYFKGMQVHGNPYMQPAEERGAWADSCDAPRYDGQEYLLYVGDVGSFDQHGRAIAKSLSTVLNAAGVSYGVLAEKETAVGNDVNKLGEIWLFEMLAQAVIEKYNELKPQKILSFSPHAYNAFKNDYPQFGAKFDVVHSSVLLADLIKSGKLTPKRETKLKVTFHDPCLLGRQNGIYDAPREILGAIPGMELVEMPRNRGNALCCGGGGGNFYTDMLGRDESCPARQRIREAAGTGASVLAVACPNCARMLEDAAKMEQLEERIEIKEITELLEGAI